MLQAPPKERQRTTSSASGRSRRHSRRTRAWYQKKRFLFPLVFMAMFMAAGGSAAWYVTAKFSTFNTLSAPPVGLHGELAPAQLILDQIEKGQGEAIGIREPVPSPSGSVTVLLMGVDAREGSPIDIGVRPDSLFVLHLDRHAQTCRTLSIPRDARVELPGYGSSKINHALAVGGVPYQILVVEQMLGIEIDHFGLLDFGGLIGVVDSIGGVTIENDHQFTYKGVTFPKGELKLDGDDALLYARYRGDNEGDFGRQRRQQQIVRAVLQQTGGLDAAQAIPDVLGDIEGHFKTDLGATSMVSLANDYRSTCTSESLQSAGLDGEIGYDWDEVEDQELSFVHVGNDELATKVHWLLNDPNAPQRMPTDARLDGDPLRRGVMAALAPRYARTAF